MVNGMGATPLMELFIMNRKVSEILKEAGIKVYRTFVGEYMTSLEMAGASITLLKLDAELKELLDAPADTPAFTQFRGISPGGGVSGAWAKISFPQISSMPRGLDWQRQELPDWVGVIM